MTAQQLEVSQLPRRVREYIGRLESNGWDVCRIVREDGEGDIYTIEASGFEEYGYWEGEYYMPEVYPALFNAVVAYASRQQPVNVLEAWIDA